MIELQVDIVSDVVCPWCVIGYKQFERALDRLTGTFDVSLRWRAFELNPGMPPEGQDLREHLAQKYGPDAGRGSGTRERLVALGADLGFTFDYHDGMRVVNTFPAHQLLHWAYESGQQTQLKLALFSAFFSERRDPSDREVLLEIVANLGLDVTEAREVLESERYAQAVRNEEQDWLDKDIHAVPAFIFNERYSVLGAQDADTFVRVLRKIESRASSASVSAEARL
ncbi:MAG: DsbA family oxidoreductase [Congregibacter sp.]